jgi:hypothetical protein
VIISYAAAPPTSSASVTALIDSTSKIWITGVQPSYLNYPIVSSSVTANGGLSSSLNARFATPTRYLGNTVTLYYGFLPPTPPTSTVATGGANIYTAGRMFHVFKSSGTFTVLSSRAVEIMAIGGGGGGGSQSGGGGGAGNMIVANGTLSATSYSVVVGAGGAGGQLSVSTGFQGGSSTFGDTIVVALGGGGGGTYNIGPGKNGGCGGGGSEFSVGYGKGLAVTGTVTSPLTATSNLATDGGVGVDVEAGSQGAAGGGGTSTAGTSHTANTSYGDPGGAGTLYYGTYFGGGGGGSQGGVYHGSPFNGGAGGRGGGGTGSTIGGTEPYVLVRGTPGQDNTGSGGGGATGFTNDEYGLPGGKGIVIVSYVYP